MEVVMLLAVVVGRLEVKVIVSVTVIVWKMVVVGCNLTALLASSGAAKASCQNAARRRRMNIFAIVLGVELFVWEAFVT
jgi:hypothetical protein